MKPIAYVQTDSKGQPYSAHGAVAAKGFELLGFDVRYFHREELDQLALSTATVVVGGMGTVRAALLHLGKLPPQLDSAPSCLLSFLGRTCRITTLNDVLNEGRFPVFVKPHSEAKLFNGQVFEHEANLRRLLTARPGFPPITGDLPVLVQSPIHFMSEWRTFVIQTKVIGASFYKGDPLVFPNGKFIHDTVAAFENAPAGYSADFGVTDEGQTVLIEINDGYSLGHGGLTATQYAELLHARWTEICAA